MKTVLDMEETPTTSDARSNTTLPAHAALIPAAARLDGEPHKGWYFAVLVRAAYVRLGGFA